MRAAVANCMDSDAGGKLFREVEKELMDALKPKKTAREKRNDAMQELFARLQMKGVKVVYG